MCTRFALCLLLLLPALALAQTPPPTGLTADHDGNGSVALNWSAPNTLAAAGPHASVDWPENDAERLGFTPPNLGELRDQWASRSALDELDEFLHYRIYRDGSQIGVTTDESFTATLGSYGSYEFTVTAFYDEGESDPSNAVTVVWYDPESFLVQEDFNSGGLPDGWVVEATVPDHTWTVVQGGTFELFDTPYLEVDSDQAGSGGVHLMERVILPPMDFDNAEYAEISFEHGFNEYIEEYCYLEVRIDGGDWITIETWDDEFTDPVPEVIDLSDWVLDEEFVELSFYYDDQANWGWWWGIDNVTVYKEGPGTPVIIDLTGTQTSVPQQGGPVVYDIEIESTLPDMITGVRFWTMVELPNGNMYGPILNVPIAITPYMHEFYVGMVQQVPGWAPAGTYEHFAYIGYYPNPYIEDSFPFTKLGGAAE